MRLTTTIVSVAVLVWLLAPPLLGASAPVEESALRSLLATWDDAYQRRDTVALQALLADDYVLTDAGGAVLDRAQYLSSVVKSPDFAKVESWTSEAVLVRVYGEAAVVTGVSAVKGRPRGRAQAFGSRYRFTDVWVRRGGTWKAVATQSTAAPAARP
jgi:ketosteroid isomerase-like protein